MITVISWFVILGWLNIVISSLGIITTGWLIYKVLKALKDETYEV